MNIRLEKTEDEREVENLTREAFWNVYRPGCTEHYVLNQYRNNPDFIPELDFVMGEDDKIIGHVMFSKAEIMLDDGSTNFDHCQYCYADGKFHSRFTLAAVTEVVHKL